MAAYGSIERLFPLALAASLGVAKADSAHLRIELTEADAGLAREGELALGLRFWVEGERPVRIERVFASVGERAAIKRRTRFFGFDLAYEPAGFELRPRDWTRLDGADGAVILTGVRPRDLESGDVRLYFDCGEAGMRSVTARAAVVEAGRAGAD